MDTLEKLPPILYVDDEENNLFVFKSAFRRNYEIFLAHSGQEGLNILKEHEIKLIITDQRMPEMTGIQFLEKLIPVYPDCIRMILTGFSDIEAIIQAINTGRVYRYITKPWDKDELKLNIDKGLETFHLKVLNKQLLQNLQDANFSLEQKVIERTNKIELQKREITRSIQYASKLQQALMPPEEYLSGIFPDFFILNKPVDIVSGDFYWFDKKDENIIIAVGDCTGHGVPGAFMSVLGITLLNEIVCKATALNSADLLNQLRIQIIKILHQNWDNKETRDGMEMSLCIYNRETRKIQYSGALRPLYIISGNEFIDLKSDCMPIGIFPDDPNAFSYQEYQLKSDDLIYMFTDGYTDQIGGNQSKTFKPRNFKDLLLQIRSKKMSEQRLILEDNLQRWMGNIDQVDDILILGIRI